LRIFRGAVAILLALAMVAGGGCGPGDDPEDGLRPPLPDPGLFPDNPDRLAQNFQTIYEAMDFAWFSRMLHPQSEMLLQDSTTLRYPELGEELDYSEELRIHERMFSKQDVLDPTNAVVPGIRSIQFQTFARQGVWGYAAAVGSEPSTETALYDVVILLDRGPSAAPIKVQGALRFQVASRDSVVGGQVKPYYRLFRLTDLTMDEFGKAGADKGTFSMAWGRVLGMFR